MKLQSCVVSLFAIFLTWSLTGDAAAGPRSRPLRTGQRSCWDSNGVAISCFGTGQDGDLRPGEPRSFVDNGDRTITDQRTGLRWERLENNRFFNDVTSTYSWAEAFMRIHLFNEGQGFAGFTDWRLPTIFELQTLFDLERVAPATSPDFAMKCTDRCQDCSCILNRGYWSSTTAAGSPESAWVADFLSGATSLSVKGIRLGVRAVRGGR